MNKALNNFWKVVKPYLPAIGMAVFTLFTEAAAVKADQEQEELQNRVAILEAKCGMEVTKDE